MKTIFALFAVIAGLNTATLFAQVSDPRATRLSNPGEQVPANVSLVSNAAPFGYEELQARIARLEEENSRMHAEVLSMREQAPQPPVTAVAPPARTDTVVETPPGYDGNGVTMPEVQCEINKMMWCKGDFKIVPYGILWGNSVFATQRTNPGTYTLFTESQSKQNEDESIVDARNTRLGVDVLGPRVPLLNCAQSGGKVEIDFQGTCAGTENKGGLLLRHAYVEVKDDDFRLLAGQTWDVISPLNPGMLMYSVGWDAGNIGYRRAQFRAERFLAFSDSMLLTIQGSVDQDIFPDSITNVTGKPAPWPIVEGRVALTLGQRTGPDALPMTFGVSSHIGQEEYNTATVLDKLSNTWSLNADAYIPITHRLGFQAEFFTGENLAPFLGGIGQGIDPTTLGGIHSTGGWCELWYDWTPCCHSHFGYSLDDPDDNDLHTAGERSYNQVYYGNVSYDLTKQFMVGLEVSSWKTLYVGLAPGESVRTEFVAKYAF